MSHTVFLINVPSYVCPRYTFVFVLHLSSSYFCPRYTFVLILHLSSSYVCPRSTFVRPMLVIGVHRIFNGGGANRCALLGPPPLDTRPMVVVPLKLSSLQQNVRTQFTNEVEKPKLHCLSEKIR